MSKLTKFLVLFFMMMTAGVSMAATITTSASEYEPATEVPAIEKFYVKTVEDAETAPEYSLRKAIENANKSNADSVSILFLFDKNEDHTIKLVKALDAISKPRVGIDKDKNCRGKVIIDGTNTDDHIIRFNGLEGKNNYSINNIAFDNVKRYYSIYASQNYKNGSLTVSNCEFNNVNAGIYVCYNFYTKVDHCLFNKVSAGIYYSNCDNSFLSVVDCHFVENNFAVYCSSNSNLPYLSKNTIAKPNTNLYYYSKDPNTTIIDNVVKKKGTVEISGYVDKKQKSTIEIFYSGYDSLAAGRYIGNIETNEDGTFSGEVSIDDKLLDKTFTISATATVGGVTGPFAFFTVNTHKLVVTNTEDDENIVESFKWACKKAQKGDVITFDFDKRGNKIFNVTGKVTTYGSIDGSSCRDSLIFKGDGPIDCCGEYVKNIKIEGFGAEGLIISSSGCLISNCIVERCSTGIVYTVPSISIVDCVVRNNIIGIGRTGPALSLKLLKKCVVENNTKIGLEGRCIVISEDTIKNNKVGLNLVYSHEQIESIDGCVITGNDSIGISSQSIISNFSNNIIGLSEDQKKILPNGIGIYSIANIENFKGNVISGNKGDGARLEVLPVFFEDNYIGTNKYFDSNPKLGNGGSGIILKIQHQEIDSKVKGFYIGNNAEYGFNFVGQNSNSVTISDSYFGITPDGKSMPNGKSGIVGKFADVSKCHIGYNGEHGIEITSSISCKFNINDCSLLENSGYGVIIQPKNETDQCNAHISNSTFDGNKLGACSNEASQITSTSILTECLFKNTQKYNVSAKAIQSPLIPIWGAPTITSVTRNGNQLIVSGIDGEEYDMPETYIELFINDGDEQTAHKFVAGGFTKEHEFSFEVDFDIIPTTVGFSATFKRENVTSELSNTYVYKNNTLLADWKSYVYNETCGDNSGKWVLEYTVYNPIDKSKELQSDFYAVITDKNGKEYKSETLSKTKNTGKIVFDNLSYGTYKDLKFYWTGGDCEGEITMETGDNEPPTECKINFYTLSLPTAQYEDDPSGKSFDLIYVFSGKNSVNQCVDYEVVSSSTGKIYEFSVTPDNYDAENLQYKFVVKNLPIDNYIVRYKGCEKVLQEIEKKPCSEFSAEGWILRESACHGQYAGMRAVMKIYDKDGSLSDYNYTFKNTQFGSYIEETDVEHTKPGIYVLHNAGKPCDIVTVYKGDCRATITLSDYEPTENDSKVNIKGLKVIPQSCEGEDNGAVELSFSGFKSYYDLSLCVYNLDTYTFKSVGTRDESGILRIDNLKVGTYKVYSRITVEGCGLSSVDTVFIDTIKIDEAQPLSAKIEVKDNPCGTNADGSIKMTMNGWVPNAGMLCGIYKKSGKEDLDDSALRLDDKYCVNKYALAAGTYICVIKDGCGNEYKEEVTIKDIPFDSVEFEVVETTPYSCPENKDGSMIVAVSNYGERYLASFDGNAFYPYDENAKGQKLFKFTDLDSEEYKFSVLDGCNVWNDFPVQIKDEREPLSLTIEVKDNPCGTNADGSIKMILNGWVPNNDMSWGIYKKSGKAELNDGALKEDGKYHANKYALSAGTYICIIKDACGREYKEEVTIKDVPFDSVEFEVVETTPYSCPENKDGSMIVAVSNYGERYLASFEGNAFYPYDENAKGQKLFKFTDLDSEEYKFSVLDGCNVWNDFPVKIKKEKREISLTINKTDNHCKNDPSGEIKMELKGWVPEIGMSWGIYKKSGTVDENDSAVREDSKYYGNKSGLSAGTYVCVIKDECGNEYSEEVTIKDDPLKAIEFEVVETTPYSCPENKDGSMIIAVSNYGQYSIAGFDGTAIKPYDENAKGQKLFKLTNLDSVEHLFRVLDDCNVWNDFPVKIKKEKREISLTINKTDNHCKNDPSGEIKMELKGWVPEIGMSWGIYKKSGTVDENDSAVSEDSKYYGNKSGLSSGTYVCVIKDECGNEYSEEVTIKDDPLKAIEFEVVETTPYSCPENKDGSMIIAVSNYGQYSIAGFDGTAIKPYDENAKGQKLFKLTNLDSVEHLFRVLDDCNVWNDFPVKIKKEKREISLTINKTDNHCKNDPSGEIKMELKGWVPEIGMSWGIYKKSGTVDENDSAVSEDSKYYGNKSGLSAGTYVCVIKDECGNEYSEEVTIKDDPLKAIEFEVVETTPYSCPENKDGSMIIAVSNYGQYSIAGFDGTAIKPYDENAKGQKLFKLTNLDSVEHLFRVLDDCNVWNDFPVDIKSYSEENGALKLDYASLAYNSACSINSKALEVKVSGGKTTSYTFNVIDADSKTVLTTATQEKGDYTSGYFADGAYIVEVVTPGNCKVTSDILRISSPFSAEMAIIKESLCDEKSKVQSVAVSVDGDATFSTLSINDGKQTQTEISSVSVLEDGRYLLKNVSKDAKYLVIGVDYCYSIFDFKDAKVEGLGASVDLNYKVLTVNPTCHDVKDGSIALSYDGFHGLYNVELSMVSLDGDSVFKNLSSNEKSDKLEYNKLPAGKYRVTPSISVDGCGTLKTFDDQDVEIASDLSVSLKLDGDDCATASIKSTIKGGATPYTGFWTDADKKVVVSNDDIESLSGAGNGKFFLTIEDKNKCKVVSDTINVNFLTHDKLKLVDVKAEDIKCSAKDEGKITVEFENGVEGTEVIVTLTGKKTNLSEKSKKQSGTVEFESLAAGEYVVSIAYTDAAACKATGDDLSKTIIVSSTSGISATASTTETTCPEVGGTATITVEGGVAPLKYKWLDEDDKELANTESTMTGVMPGKTYSCVVTDANDCEVTVTDIKSALVSLDDLSGVEIDPTVVGQKCYGVANGSVAIKLTGADEIKDLKVTLVNDKSKDSTYAVKNADGVYNFEKLLPGDYKLYLGHDIEGCASTSASVKYEKTLSIAEIAAPLAIDKNYINSSDATCGASNGTAEAKAGNWSEYYSFNAFVDGKKTASELTVNGDSATVSLTGLGKGSVMFVASDVCDNTDTIKYEIKQSGVAPTIELVEANAYSCPDCNDGSLVLAVSNFESSYVAIFDGVAVQSTKKNELGQALFEFAELGANTYKFEVVDNCEDTTLYSFDMKDYAEGKCNLKLDYFKQVVASACSADNKLLKIGVSGEESKTYTFNIIDSKTEKVVESVTQEEATYVTDYLVDGSYYAEVSISDFCKVTSDVVKIASAMTAELSIMNLCEGSSAETQNVIVSVLGNVSGESSFVVISGEDKTETAITSISLFNDGRFLLNNVSKDAKYLKVTIGSCATIADFKNAKIEETDSSLDLTYKLVAKNPSCVDTKDGNISFTYSDFNGLYDVSMSLTSLDGTATYPDRTSSNKSARLDYSKLPAGSYHIETWISAPGCGVLKTIVSTDTTIASDLAVKVALDGDICTAQSIKSTITGGKAPYTGFWTESDKDSVIADATIEKLSDAGSGKFFLTVIDNNDCKVTSDTISTDLVSFDKLKLVDVDVVSGKCDGGKDGKVTVEFENGTAGTEVVVTLTGVDTNLSVKSDESKGSVDFESIPAGDYVVSINYADAGNCPNVEPITKSIVVLAGTKLDATASTTDADCQEVGGTATIIVEGGIAPFSFKWLDEDNKVLDNTDSIMTGLVPGKTYSCVVTDANDCETTVTDIKSALSSSEGFVAPTIELVDADAYSCPEKENGSATLAVSDFDESYVVTLNDKEITASGTSKEGKTLFVLSNLGADTYNFVITDKCKNTTPYSLDMKSYSEKNGALKIDYFKVVDAASCSADSKRLTAAILGGNADAFTFNIVNAETKEVVETSTQSETSYKTSILTEGSYYVEVVADECKVTSDVVSLEGSAIAAEMSILKPSLCPESSEVRNVMVAVDGDPTFAAVDGDKQNETEIASVSLLEDGRFLLKNVAKEAQYLKVSVGECSSLLDFSKAKVEALEGEFDFKHVLSAVNPTCLDATNGAITFEYSEFLGLYNVNMSLTSLDGVSTYKNSSSNEKSDKFEYSELPTGNYRVETWISAPGCETVKKIESKDVTLESNFSVALTLGGDACTPVLKSKVSGGVAPVSGFWSDADKKEVIDGADIDELMGVGSGRFFLTLVDDNKCKIVSDTVAADLVSPDKLKLVDVNTVSNKCFGDKEGKVTVDFENGIVGAPASIYLTAEGTESVESVKDQTGSVVFNTLAAGKYSIYIGYTATPTCRSKAENVNKSATITEGDKFTALASTTLAPCVEVGGTATVTADGGVAPLTYKWYDEDGKALDNTESKLTGVVPGKAYSCKITDSNDCETSVADIKTSLISLDKLSAIEVAPTPTDQKCYGVANGEIEIKLSGSADTKDVIVTVVAVETEESKTAVKAKEGLYKAETLLPGDYKLLIGYEYEGCSVASTSVEYKNTVSIAKIAEPLSVDKSYKESKDSRCYNEPNGTAEVKVGYWSKFYSMNAYEDGTKRDSKVTLDGDAAIGVVSKLRGGQVKLVASDICGNKDSIVYEMKKLDEPKIELIDSHVKLRCSYSADGFLKYSFTGGDPETYDIEFNKAGFEKSDYSETKLFDELTAGNYTVVYRSVAEGCSDKVSMSNRITAPQPMVNLKGISPLLCNDEATGEFSFVPHRRGTKIDTAKLSESKNYAVEVFNGNFEALKTAFREVKSVEITSATQTPEQLKEALKNALTMDEESDELTAKYYPLSELWLDEIGEKVPVSWIGFDELPSDIYTITTTDTAGCVFKEDFDVTQNPIYNTLSIDEVIFNAEAAACKAEDRRIEIKVSGGWGNYGYSVAKIDGMGDLSGAADSIQNSNNNDVSSGGGFSTGTSAAQDSTSEKDGTGYYRSAILEQGHYFISVTDSMGCFKYYSDTIEVKSNLSIDGTIIMDKCDPTAFNKIDAVATANDGYNPVAPYTFKVKYEKDSVEVSGESLSLLADNIPSGDVGIYITDANQCGAFKSFRIVPSDTLVVLTVKHLESLATKCYGDSSGSVVFKVFGGNHAYEHFVLDDDTLSHDDNIMTDVDDDYKVIGSKYPLSHIDLNSIGMSDILCMTDIPVGEHKLQVSDAEGCVATMEFTITEPDTLILTAKATGVCPDGTGQGRVLPDILVGGTEPYTYALDYDQNPKVVFTKEKHQPAKVDQNHKLYVKDANGCIAYSQEVAVTGTVNLDKVSQNCVVSTWHDMGDIVVVVDVSEYGGAKVDSVTYEMDNLPDGVTYEEVPKELYIYGIPEEIVGIEWQGDSIYGPLWGIPADIAAGVKDETEYAKIKSEIDAQKKTVQDKIDADHKSLVEKRSQLQNASDLNKIKIENDIKVLMSDSTAFADTLASILSREKANCTIKMITDAFKPLVPENVMDKLTYLRISSQKELDMKSFKFDFKMVSYVNDCSLNMEFNNMGVAVNDTVVYKDITKKDIQGIECAPNPVNYGGDATVFVNLADKTDVTYSIYNFKGETIASDTEADMTNLEELEDKSYKLSFDIKELKSSCIVTVRTKSDAASLIILVNGSGN